MQFLENLHLMAFGDLDLILTSHDAQNAFFCTQALKNILFENLHSMTIGDLDPLPTSSLLELPGCTTNELHALIISEIQGIFTIFTPAAIRPNQENKKH